MKVVISASGSGGHIYPAISLIKKIKELEPDAEILYVGTKYGVENTLINKNAINFLQIESYPFERVKIWKNFKLIGAYFKSYYLLKKRFKTIKPDVVIGFGGHVTVPVIRAASKLKIKCFIHEQNKIIGRANKFLSKKVTAILTSYDNTIGVHPDVKDFKIGNPSAENALNVKAMPKSEVGLDPNKKLVLIIMGSQGSATVNKYLEHNLNNLSLENYEIFYLTGERNYKEEYETMFKEGIFVKPYFDNLASLMKSADLVVSRAGATTICEIMALRKPSILIPSPYVPDNHQYHNAKDLFDKNAAIYLAEKELENLNNMIEKMMSENDKIRELQYHLDKIRIDNSATLIYNVLKQSGEIK